jgi:transcription elongation factor GreA
VPSDFGVKLWEIFLMNMEKFPMTAEGYSAIENELKHLKTVERKRIIQSIASAREHGDLSENAEYHAAKEEQAFNETKIGELEDRLSKADVIDISGLSGKDVKFGARVSIVDEDTEDQIYYQIVGEHEADLSNGKISITSPVARALIGKSVGDSVEVSTPNGSRYFEIVEVGY